MDDDGHSDLSLMSIGLLGLQSFDSCRLPALGETCKQFAQLRMCSRMIISKFTKGIFLTTLGEHFAHHQRGALLWKGQFCS